MHDWSSVYSSWSLALVAPARSASDGFPVRDVDIFDMSRPWDLALRFLPFRLGARPRDRGDCTPPFPHHPGSAILECSFVAAAILSLPPIPSTLVWALFVDRFRLP